jgi:hypothetical protein
MTPRTMTESEAWREIARRIVEGEWRDWYAYTLVFALLGAITRETESTMDGRIAAHLRLARLSIDANPEPRALAALWLALEAEEEGA